MGTEKKRKVLVTESLSGVFNLAHRKGFVYEFEAKRAQEIVDSGRGQWALDEKETAAKAAKAAPKGETATDKAAGNAEQS